MAGSEPCVFCKIAGGELPARVVFRDDLAVAFDDINPQAPVHVLVVPVRHIDDLEAMTDADRELVGHLYRVAARIASERGFADKGYRLVLNNGKGAGQVVPHLHLHVFSGRRFGWPPG